MDLEFDINVKDFMDSMKRFEVRAVGAGETAVNDFVDEIIRIASEITPIDKGTLTKSHTRTITKSGGAIEAEIAFSVREGDFNYALWIHEGVYNLGAKSKARSGTTGWSGKKYEVGRKYLERPIKGEQEAFQKHVAKLIDDRVGGAK